MEYTLDTYIKNTAEIRRLSSPHLASIGDAEAYRNLLRDNFVKIGELAKENRRILEEEFYPLVRSASQIPHEKLEELNAFGEQLLDAYSLENLDPNILVLLTERLLNDVKDSASDDIIIRQLDGEVMACYTMVNMTRRIISKPEISESFRQRGLEAGALLLKYLEKDRFAKLSAESKELVLINARYICVLYEGVQGTKELNARNMEMLDRAIGLGDDAFYREQCPDYDWAYHKFRALEYTGMLCEYHNERGMSHEQCMQIAKRQDEMYELWKTDPVRFEEVLPETEVKMNVLRAHYEAGMIERDRYYRELIGVYGGRDKSSYELVDIFTNLLTPLEYILSLDEREMTELQSQQLGMFYRNMINYVYQMPNAGSLSYVLEYFSAILEHFVEVPGVIDFETMCVSCMAALHPPTYIHTMMVGKITRCLCRHLLRLKPEVFERMRGEMQMNDADIMDFAYHAAICHDIGKIPIIDTIMVYGRKILDQEFELIKQHPDMGALMMQKYASTRRYVNVARGHHKWYDNTMGYPAEFDTSTVPEKAVIDIVTCADCLDAATDTVGRSYNAGKTVDDFVQELKEGSGRRYAPFLIELFEQDAVCSDIDYLLKQGREENYLDTYILLREVQERSEAER